MSSLVEILKLPLSKISEIVYKHYKPNVFTITAQKHPVSRGAGWRGGGGQASVCRGAGSSLVGECSEAGHWSFWKHCLPARRWRPFATRGSPALRAFPSVPPRRRLTFPHFNCSFSRWICFLLSCGEVVTNNGHCAKTAQVADSTSLREQWIRGQNAFCVSI